MFRFVVTRFALIVLMALTSSVQAEYWWGVSGKEPLIVDTSQVLIRLKPGTSIQDARVQLMATGCFADLSLASPVIEKFYACTLVVQTNYKLFLDLLLSVESVELVEPAYASATGVPVIVGADFCVGFKPDVTRAMVDSVAAVFGAAVKRQADTLSNGYLLRRTTASARSTLALANLFREELGCTYSHPDFLAKIEKNAYMLYDYYNQYQQNIKKVIGSFNSRSVWDFAGLNRAVNVAVIDDGFAIHEDLPASRVLQGYDAADHDYDVTPDTADAHGQACAGIIAASHTTDPSQWTNRNTGVISMNPYAKIMPVKIFTSIPPPNGDNTPQEIADGINYARDNGAAVLSNSWQAGLGQPAWPVVATAIENAYYYGRGGRGCLVVFSSGNSGINTLPFPARANGAFAVGAIDSNDYRWNYSNYSVDPCCTLMVVAPSGDKNYLGNIWSIDQMGRFGYNKFLEYIETSLLDPISPECTCPPGQDDLNYLCNFGGTSGACPIVAGVASLLIARDSMLTVETIEDVLCRSAVTKLAFDTLEVVPDPMYGYGRVDAFRAVLSIVRGDVNNSAGVIDLSDLSALVSYLTGGGFIPFPSILLGDLNCDGFVNLPDLAYTVNYLTEEDGDPPVRPCYVN